MSENSLKPHPVHTYMRKTHEPIDWDSMGVPHETRQSFGLSMLNYTLNDYHGFYMEPESGDGHCDPNEYTKTVADRIATVGAIYNGGGPNSPIEHRMLGALVWINQDHLGFPKPDFFNGPKEHLEAFGELERAEFFITCQAPLGRYKADILLWVMKGNKSVGVVVECDGHNFHEKTKEQAAHDKRRDREILSMGYPVMRFTGSEIFKDAQSCAEQVSSCLYDRIYEAGYTRNY